MVIFSYVSDYVDEDEEDDEYDDEDDNGIMADCSSVGNSNKFDSTNTSGINYSNNSNEESLSMRISTSSGFQNESMSTHEDINVKRIQNDSQLSITDFENNNESDGK